MVNDTVSQILFQNIVVWRSLWKMGSFKTSKMDGYFTDRHYGEPSVVYEQPLVCSGTEGEKETVDFNNRIVNYASAANTNLYISKVSNSIRLGNRTYYNANTEFGVGSNNISRNLVGYEE